MTGLTPKISVVIPLFDKEEYIARALESVIAQTVKPSEIIVVNDGSGDNGPGIAETYPIRLINQENLGESSARNTGIKNAEYPFIAFLDADDEWMPDFLSSITYLLNNYPEAGFYSTGFQKIRIKKTENIYSPLHSKNWHGIIDNYFKTCTKAQIICSSSAVVKKEIFNSTGLFAEGIVRGADLDMWARIALSHKLAFMNRIHVKCHYNAKNRVCDRYRPMDFIFIKYCKKHNIKDPDIYEYIAKKQFFTAKSQMEDGKKPRDTLKEYSNTRLFRSQYRILLLLTYFPRPIVKILLKLLSKANIL